MRRVDMVLAAGLMLCALAVVNAQHHARTLFVELEALKTEARDLEVEWGKLQLEQGTLHQPRPRGEPGEKPAGAGYAAARQGLAA